MDTGHPDSPAFRRNFILLSAYFHAQPPSNGFCTANCARVLRHALTAAGLWDDRLAENQSAFFSEDDGSFPVVGLWYSELIGLTHERPESERLLNGGGNLITPSGAYFTACWLTDAGRAVAEQLLADHPELRAKIG